MATKANEMPEVSDEVFALIARELAGGKPDEALWTKAFALQNGDESATKAHYIRLRVEQITRNASEEIKSDSNQSTKDTRLAAGPWPRYFARYLDLTLGVSLALWLLFLLLTMATSSGFKMAGPTWVIFILAIGLLGLLPWLFDAAIVATFGNSLGKAIWGITVRHKDGRPLTFKETLNRNILVCLHGFWTGLTPLTFLPHIFSYNRLKKDEQTKWDAKGNYEVFSINPGAFRKIIGITLLIVATMLLGITEFSSKIVGNKAFKTESTKAPKPNAAVSEIDQFLSSPNPTKPNVQQYQDLTLGMSMDDVIHAKGQPSHVLEDENEPAPKGWQKVIARNDLRGSIYNYPDWQYENVATSTRIDVSFSRHTRILTEIGCYAKLAGECGLLGITSGMSSAQILGRLGKPDYEKIENATLIWDYASRNVLIYFSENNAYMIKLENPFNRFDK